MTVSVNENWKRWKSEINEFISISNKLNADNYSPCVWNNIVHMIMRWKLKKKMCIYLTKKNKRNTHFCYSELIWLEKLMTNTTDDLYFLFNRYFIYFFRWPHWEILSVFVENYQSEWRQMHYHDSDENNHVSFHSLSYHVLLDSLWYKKNLKIPKW